MVVFFSTVSSVLYYVGKMQVIIKAIYYMLFSPFCPIITSGGILYCRVICSILCWSDASYHQSYILYVIFTFFVQILLVVVFFSAVSSVIYYVGVMQVTIKAIYYMLFSPFCPDISSGGIHKCLVVCSLLCWSDASKHQSYKSKVTFTFLSRYYQ